MSRVVIVEWMDGAERDYKAIEEAKVSENCLWLYGVPSGFMSVKLLVSIPLANVRMWRWRP